MDNQLVVLKLFLDAVGEQSAIDSLPDRLRIQKVVYLGQVFGADLGYRYNWYARGPYSPSLTQDYYSLASEDATSIANAIKGKALNSQTTSALARAKLLLKKPPTVQLDLPSWYELVASIDYLRRVSKLPEDGVRGAIEKYKPALSGFYEIAKAQVLKYAPPLPNK